jgi:plasmid maintenance system antidote protein VapI
VRRLDADPNLSLRTLAEDVGIDRSRIGAIWRSAHPGETRPPAPARANLNTARANPNTAGITPRLDADPDLSMTALAKELGLHGSTVSRAWQAQHIGENRPRTANPPVRQEKRD